MVEHTSGWEDLGIYAMQALGYAGAAVGGAVLSRFKHWLSERKRKSNSLTHVLDQSLSIRECLVELRTKVDCDLTFLLQIKNGIYYSSGESEQKVTITHVSPRFGHGVDPLLIRSLTDIPISIIGHSVKLIMSGGLYLPIVKEMQPDDFYLRQIFSGLGTACVQFIPIFNKTNNLVGVAGLAWFEKTNALEPEHRPDIQNAQQRLGLLLIRK